MLWIISSWSFIGSPIADVLPFMHKLHYCSKACVQWFTAPAMNVSGRHLSCGHSESRSPDRPRFLLLQVAGPSAGRTGCPRGRHHGKCGFCGSFERTTVQSQQRHLQFYCRFGYRRVWASLPWKALRHTDDAFATLCFCLQTSEPVPMLNNKPRIISALQQDIFIFIQTLWDHDVKAVKVNTRKQRNVQHSHFFVMKQFPSIKSSSRKQKLCLGSVNQWNVTWLLCIQVH